MMSTSTTKNIIYSIKGGVHPPFHKEESTQQPISQAKIPESLIVPVRQHTGMPGHLMVKKGDYIYKGQPITDQPDGLGSVTHAPTSGTITAIDRFPVPHISGYSCPGIIIEPDGKEDWGDQRLPPLDFISTDNNDLLARIREAGVVGLGGAAFPSAVKISGSVSHPLKSLIINGAECEPYITCDDMLMREHADEIILGIQVLLKMLKPEQCLIGIEDNKPEAIQAMQDAVNKADVNATPDINIQVVSIPAIYPSGDAKQLTKILTGVEIPKGKRSYEMGTLCHNVATAHSVFKAVIKGEPLISRVVTVTGAGGKEPQNFEVLLGTTFSQLIHNAGGYTDKAERLIMGGPMMGFPMQTARVPIVKATNCILVLPEADLPYSTNMAMPCIRCGKCAEACPVDLLPQQLYWHARADDFEKVQQHHLFDCIECGCCSYVCPSNIPLVNYYRYAKSSVREEKENQKKMNISRERHEFREFRQTRDKAERDAKRAQHKAALQKKKAAMAKKKAARGNTSKGDVKTDAIKAAMERVKAKQDMVKNDPKNKPRNTENLTASQKKQIKDTDQSREKVSQKSAENKTASQD
jgi:electron transport complex protein RnfC